MRLKALITGVCGQDGYYLSQLLLSKGYEVVGTRRGNNEAAIRTVFADVTDAACIRELLDKERPDEVYNLAAVTNVGESFHAIGTALAINAGGCANVLEATARIGAKFYQASTSELFGDSPPPQNEETAMRPRSPYAVAKLAAYWLTRNYRERGLHATNGILFNHESVRRGGGFVTQKVARAVARIAKEKQGCVVLGNLSAVRDWGHAKDFVRGMWMLMQERPGDYVLATGETHSVGELCEVAFARAGLDWQKHVQTSAEFCRPLEVENLCGNAAKANAVGWQPTISFEEMVHEMVDHARQLEAVVG